MPTSALLLILLSAAMHAGWNLILKTTRHKLPFNVFMHACAIAIFSAYWLLRYGAIPPPSGPVLPFLDERLSLLGMAGILVVFLGAYILQMRELSWTGLSFPLRNIRHPGVLLAFSAGVFYSVGTIVDKRGVTVADVFVYTYYLDIALFLFLLSNALLTNSRNQFLEEIRAHWLRGIAAGFILFLSFTTYRLGLQMSKVFYAVSVRQVSAIVGVVGGILLFRERFGRIRFSGAALIVLGIACIKLG